MIVGCLEKWGSTCYFRENDAPISIIFSDKTSGLLASFFATSGRIYTSQVGIDTNWGKIHLETMYFCYKWEASHFASPHLQVRCSHHQSPKQFYYGTLSSCESRATKGNMYMPTIVIGRVSETI